MTTDTGTIVRQLRQITRSLNTAQPMQIGELSARTLDLAEVVQELQAEIAELRGELG